MLPLEQVRYGQSVLPGGIKRYRTLQALIRVGSQHIYQSLVIQALRLGQRLLEDLPYGKRLHLIGADAVSSDLQLLLDKRDKFGVLVGRRLRPPAVVRNEQSLGILYANSLDKGLALIRARCGDNELWVVVLLYKRFQVGHTILQALRPQEHDVCMGVHNLLRGPHGVRIFRRVDLVEGCFDSPCSRSVLA